LRCVCRKAGCGLVWLRKGFAGVLVWGKFCAHGCALGLYAHSCACLHMQRAGWRLCVLNRVRMLGKGMARVSNPSLWRAGAARRLRLRAAE